MRSYQYEVSKRENIYAYVEATDENFEERRNFEDIVFCEYCEDYYTSGISETLCYKCRKYEYCENCNVKEII